MTTQTTRFDVEAFAKKCGVKISECDPAFGGKYQYWEPEYPHCFQAGYKTKRIACIAWLKEKFGSTEGKLLLKEIGVKL